MHICSQDFSKEKFLLHLNYHCQTKLSPLFISDTSCKEDTVKGTEDIEKRGATKHVKTCWLTPQMARQSHAGFLVILYFPII